MSNDIKEEYNVNPEEEEDLATAVTAAASVQCAKQYDGFVEPRPVKSEEDVLSAIPTISASTPKLMRRYSEDPSNMPNLFDASPLIKLNCMERNRSASQPHNAFDASHSFALNNLSQSLCNDSGINECSFAGAEKAKSARRVNLLDETPPGILYDHVEDAIVALSDEENEDPHLLSNKRGLSDSYIRLKENSPSVPQMKRQSGDVLPRVPNCFDTSYERPPLIGDNSREYLLPYNNKCNSEHCDFKCLTPETLADLLQGRYDTEVKDTLIIDTRYPYEYEGGHIEGAVNVVLKEDLLATYLTKPNIPSNRQVVIMHCEFSSKRGPSMCRFMRDQDRLLNTHRYPQLFYPEIYILHGGYKDFFPLYPELCSPQNYVLMLDPEFEDQCTYWQKTAKTSFGGNGQTTVRSLKSRIKSSRQLLLS